jgi:NADH dehydrogenase (ubiquinone) 1 alpha subcomplex subunit 6
MYSLGIPVSKIRTKIRQEFERHRYVNSLPAVDVLLTQSHMEFQVGQPGAAALGPITRVALMDLIQETLNYWKQLTHVMKYFRQEEDPKARFPKSFISGFLEVFHPSKYRCWTLLTR